MSAPGAPYAYVTTPDFLSHFGFQTLRDLPYLEVLEDAGLLSKDRLLAEDAIGLPHGDMTDEDEIDLGAGALAGDWSASPSTCGIALAHHDV